MLFKTALLLIVVLAATTVSAAPPDHPLMWLWQRAWPKQQQQPVPVTPMPAAKPKATRSIEHRKVHRPGPRMVKREAAPLPRVRAPAAILKDEKRARFTVKKQRVAGRQQRKPTANECARMTSAGRAVVTVGARLRGYPDDVVQRALRDCGL